MIPEFTSEVPTISHVVLVLRQGHLITSFESLSKVDSIRTSTVSEDVVHDLMIGGSIEDNNWHNKLWAT